MTAPAEPIVNLDFLLSVIETGNVIPIVGPDLVTVAREDGVQVPLDQFLAPLLAQRLGVRADLAPDATISDVAAMHARQARAASALVPFHIHALLKQLRIPIPEPLRKLASIRKLRLFVSLTFDSLLAAAIRDVRGGVRGRVEERAYSRKRAPVDVDLPEKWDVEPSAVVFHLFGRISDEMPQLRDYVITEEDRLEWVRVLQAPEQQPEHLFDQLREKNVLFIGCRFPDWLARFAIRAAKGMEFSKPREVIEFIADASATCDRTFTMFLDHFSASAIVFRGSATAFVDELATRWHETHPTDDGDPGPGAPVKPRAPSNMPSGSVFISYARENEEEAKCLRAGLEKDLEVWLDLFEIEPGADWDLEIQRRIRECAVFVPLLSRSAARQQEGNEYFRREWAAAVERLPAFTGIDREFVVPVLIDDIELQTSGIPAPFRTKQAVHLAGGVPSDAFRNKLIAIVKQFHEQRAVRS